MANADISLLFGVAGEGSLSGESGSLIQSQLNQIMSALNKAPMKVKVALDTEAGGQKSWSSQLQSKLNTLSTSGKFSVQVSNIKIGAGAIADFRKQLSAVINTLNLDKGTSITLTAEGIGEVKSQLEQAGNAASDAARKTAEFKVQMEALNSLKTSVKQSLNALTTGNETEEEKTRIAELTTQYEQWAVKIEEVRASKTAATGEYRAELEQEGAAIQANILELQQERQAVIDNENAKKAEAAAAKSAKEAESEQTRILIQDSAEYNTALNKINTALVQAKNNMNSWTAAKNGKTSGDYGNISNQVDELTRLREKLLSGGLAADEFNTRYSNAMREIKGSAEHIRAAGENTKTFSDRMGSLASKFTSWLTVSQVIMQVYRALKQMVTAVIEVDTAMTELKKVTDETEATYSRFLDNAASRSKQLGATLADTVNATADFARLGYTLEEASQLADAALVYKNVGDGIEDISEASESLISTMKAFGVSAEDSMFIVDKFNETGNNFAISSKGVGDALLRSASALAAANNSLDESIALITAANSTVQDADKVGTTLKTVSMFLRAAKTEAEDAGESTEGMASSVSELRAELLALTGGKVDIQIDDDTFKSTYQIMKELSEVWGELTDISQANILEMIGGKRNSNVVMSLLENFDIAEEVMESTANAAGSALAENEKYLDSIEGKISQFKATFQELGTTLIGSDFVKEVVEIGTGLLNILNAVASVIDKIGGLNTILLELSGILIAINIKAIGDKLVKVGSSITSFWGKLKELGPAMKIAKSEGKGLSSALELVGFSASAAQIAIVAITTAITIAIAAYKNWRRNIEQQRQEQIEAAKAADEEADNIMDLYSAYQTANEAYSSNTGSKEALESATHELLAALGYEESQIQSLIDEYGSLDDAINNVTLDALTDAVSKAKTGYRAAYNDLEDSFGNGSDWGENVKKYFGFGNGSNLLSWMEETEELNGKVSEILKGAGLVSEGGTGKTGGTMLIDTDSVDEIIASYDKLIQARELLQENLTTDEYNESGAVEMIEGKITDFEPILSEYLDARNLLNESLAKQQIFDALTENGIPETSAEVDALKEELISAAQASDDFAGSGDDVASAFDTAFDEISEAVPGLANVMNQSAEVAETASDIYSLASAQITQSAENAAEAATTLIDGISAAQDAINGQQTGMSISIDDFNSDALKDYQSALEYVNGTMQLNAEKVREISQAKADEQVAINNTNKALEQAKYLENAKEIERLRQSIRDLSGENWFDSDAESTINAQIDALLEENSAIAATCAQYDLLSASIQEAVGAYQNWLNAQSASDYGDMASDTVDAIQQIRDTYDANSDIFGNFGSKKFDAAVDFIVPDSVDSEDLSAIESYMADFKQYLTFDDDGAVEGLNVDKFLENAVKAGLMTYNDDDGFKIAGQKSMDDFAEGLNLSSGVVQAFFDELQLKGAEFDWGDEAVKTIGDLAIEANEAAEALRQLDGNENLKIKMDVSDLDTTEEQLAALDATIAEMDGVKSKPGIDTTSIDNANAVIQYCLTQKQLLTQPDVMRVDTSQVEGDVGYALSLLQEFQTAQNELEIQSKIGADTTDAETKINTLVEEIQGISPDIKANLSLDTTSAESIQSSIEELTADTIHVKAKVDASAITGYNPETKTCDVIYNPNTDALPISFDAVERTVNYTADTTDLPTEFSTLTRYVRYIKTGDVSVNGTAHAGGTALASGDWGTAPGGKTLVGELGREIVVDPRTGLWYTVGDTGAEFRDIPAGAIVFNHKQTENLLANGYVSGRASALVGGTAMVTGGYKPYTPSSSSTSRTGSNNTNRTSTVTVTAQVDNSSLEESLEDTLEKLKDEIDDIIGNFEHSIFLLEKNGGSTSEIVAIYRKMQEAVHAQAEKYRALGLDENSDYIQELQKQWWEYQDSIQEVIVSAYDKAVSEHENAIKLTENWMDNAISSGNIQDAKINANDIVAYYKQMQDIIHEQAEYYRKQGYSDTSDEVSELSDLWWEYAENIKEVKQKVIDSLMDMVTAANDAVDEIQNVYDVLHDAANEYAADGYISVDSLQAIIDLGAQYMQLLMDENGKLVINEERINAVIAARTQQLALENAMAYVERIRLALQEDSVEDLNNLLYATTEATDATWGLVYAELALMHQTGDLDDTQYSAALHNIQALQSLANSAINGIGQVAGATTEELNNMKSGLDDILKYVMDMLKQKINDQIEALEDMKDAYGDIIELRKETLEAAKDEADYQDEVAEKVKEIAKLQERINALSLDDSRDAQAQKAQLEEEMYELQNELADKQSDYAVNAQKDALDDMSEAYAQEKDEEIAILENSISSYQKLYDMAIDYIESHWDTLYSELIAWNTEYGDVLNSEITTAWDNCLAAAQRYGSYVSALSSIDADISAASGESHNDIVADTNYDSSSTKEDNIHAIIKEMYANSQEHHTASKERKAWLDSRNLQLGSMLAQYGVYTHRDNGTWYIDGTNELLYDKYKKYLYHKGGIAGDEPTLKQNEIMAILEKGETVLDKKKEQGLYRLIDFTTTLADKFGKLVSSTGYNTVFGLSDNGIPKSAELAPINESQSSSVAFGDVYIYGASDETVEKHREINRQFTNEVLKQLNIKR